MIQVMDISQQESGRAGSKLSVENPFFDSPLTRSSLESLSTAELIKLADSFGIDIPFGLERVFIIEELLETALPGRDDSEDVLEASPDIAETAALPKQYNITYIEIMIRDPFWAFVFWEIKEHDRQIHENAPDFEGYCLRVIPMGEGGAGGDSFTVPVDVNDSARYLGFQHEPQTPASRRYIVKLCAMRDVLEAPLASSRVFSLPGLNDTPDRNNELRQYPCISLSGARDFSVIKNADRQFRAKRQ